MEEEEVGALEFGLKHTSGARGWDVGRRSVVTTRPHPSSVAWSPDKSTLPARLAQERGLFCRGVRNTSAGIEMLWCQISTL